MSSLSSGSSSSGGHPTPPLGLTSMSKNTFYIAPVANPDLVLALMIPGHPLYSGHALPSSPSEARLHTGGEDRPAAKSHGGIGSTLSHFFGSAANTVTNTAASTIGIKNQLELHKPRLKLVTRSTTSGAASLNQRWTLSKEDGCIYSCVEEKDGSYYRLGLTKNQMIRVLSKEEQMSQLGAPIVSTNTASSSSDPPSTTQNSLASSGSSLKLVDSPSNGSSGGANGTSGTISVTTARGSVVFCPLRWEAHKYVKADDLKSLISINSIHVVIEDLEATSSSSFNFGRSSSVSSSSGGDKGKTQKPNISGSRLLLIKNICCGNLDCELEKIDVGSPCSFKGEKDSEVTMNGAPDTPAVKNATSSLNSNGPNLKQVWRIESDFSIWLSTLSRSVSTEYTLTRKLQKVEQQRRTIRDATPDPIPQIPMKFTIDYDYTLVWSTEGTKASQECSIWRPKFPSTNSHVYFGDFLSTSIKPPTKKESLVISTGLNGALHRSVVRPIDFELIWTKPKGKLGNLYVWRPIGPPGVDAIPLGDIVTCGKKEEKPSVQCGVVLVLREYTHDTGHALSTALWTDTNIGGSGPIGSLWSARGVQTFFCNPGTHSPPLGTYYTLLSPEDLPEKCPLLRPVETMSSKWESVWDDKGTLATQDVSVWRPMVEKTYVRFGDLVVRGHAPPNGMSIIAKDHPAFQRPRSFKRVAKFYRGTRKCHVWEPIPHDTNHIALGFVVSTTKEEPPSLDCIRCVHKDALIPLGIMKQMWIEHHAGMMSTLTLGMTNFMNLSKDAVVNMLWKNRSLNTFLVRQNTHARPEGMVYRLTMTEHELTQVVGELELHARWVLESFYLTLKYVENMLKESSFKRLSITPKQLSTVFHSIKGIFKYLHESDGDSSAFTLSSEARSFLKEYEEIRLRQIYGSVKRYLYETICEDVKDHDSTLEILDDNWSLLLEMPDVHKVWDHVEDWSPKLNTRFGSTQTRSLISILMDEHIGQEIFERFLAVFPPHDVSMTMDDDDDDDEDAGDANQSTPAPTPSPDPNSAQLTRQTSIGDNADAASKQQADIKATLDKLSNFSSDLDAVISITDQMAIRKLYLERYGHYLTHTLQQEFPVRGSTARVAQTQNKLGMSSILAIVSWITGYMELVEQDLLDGDREESAEVLAKMEELQDKFMDCHDAHAQGKILTWVSNILRQEERTGVEYLEGGDLTDSNRQYYYFTSGPSDLFLNINTLFDNQSANLTGRPLARIAMMFVHVLTYYQQVQGEYLKHLRALKDRTDHETVRGKQPIPNMNHAGSLDKPYAYVLAQINNARLYQSNVDELGEKVLNRLRRDDASDEVLQSIEDAFELCSEDFQTLGLGGTEVLIRHIAIRLESSFKDVFNEKVWFADPEFFQTAIIDELDELSSYFIPNIEGGIYATHLLRESVKNVIIRYVRAFMKLKLSNMMTPSSVAERIRSDRTSIYEYCSSIKRWNILDVIEKPLKQLDLFIDFLNADVDFLKLQVTEVSRIYPMKSPTTRLGEITAGVMTAHLLSLRNDVASEDRKMWLAPFTAELKALEDARSKAAIQTTTSKIANILSIKANPSPSPVSPLGHHLGGGIGSSQYGLEIFLQKGTDLVIRDTTTSDPYVNILLLNASGARLDKHASRTISKTLNPVWNETFNKFRPNDVTQLNRIRFEVWDKDLIGKDYMGGAEITVEEIRSKQLLECKSAVSRTSVSGDFTQEPIYFHLKLQCREGKQNTGSDRVSGFIDVRIKYFKVDGVSPPASASSSSSGKGRLPPADDDLDFGLDDEGQTGSKRPPPQQDGQGAGSAPPSASSASSSTTPPPSVPSPDAISEGEAAADKDRNSVRVINEIEHNGPKFDDVVKSSELRLARLPPNHATRKRQSKPKSNTTRPTSNATLTLPLTKGVAIGNDTLAQASHKKHGDPDHPDGERKALKKKESNVDFFGLV